MNKNVLVIGAGAFGISIGQTIQKNNNNVYYLTYKEEIKNELLNKKSKAFEDIELLKPTNVFISYEEASIIKYDFILIALPSKAITSTWEEFIKIYKHKTKIINLSKGINEKEAWSSYFLNFDKVTDYASLSGPSFAKEIILNKKTLVNLISSSESIFNEFKSIINNDNFKISYLDLNYETSTTLIASMKNIVAIGMSIVKNKYESQNTFCALLTICFKEIKTIINSFHKVSESELIEPFSLGDILLTCSSDESRNFKYGQCVAEFGVKEANQKCANLTVEGLNAISSLDKLLKDKKIETIFFSNLIDLLNFKIDVDDFLNNIWNSI